MAGSTGVVVAAMIANGGIAVLKFFGFLLTGSPSMLAETYHSISDTGNQVLLLVGIKYSEQEPSETHPFGYGKAQFFYAFLVSVLLFGIAGWESLKHGYAEISHGGHEVEAGAAEFLGYTIDIPLPVEAFWLNVAILLGAIGFESWAFLKARKELIRQMGQYDWAGYREAFARTSDLTTLTAFTEDTVALVGLIVALGGILATRVTGNPIFDALGAAVIGVLLMVFAIALAVENKRLIVGESVAEEVEDELRAVVENHESVTHVDTLRTMYLGPQHLLVTANVSFDPELVTDDVSEDLAEIERKLKDKDNRVSIVYVQPEV